MTSLKKENKNYSGVFRISNGHLIALTRWLNNISLAGQESRERTRFIETVSPHIKEIDEKRIELVKKYANKNDDGTPATVFDSEITNDDGTVTRQGEHFDVPEEQMENLNKEFEAYLQENFELNIGDGNIAKFNTVKGIVLNTTEKFQGSFAVEYDEWCKAFESVQ
jgi:hypothetical protein